MADLLQDDVTGKFAITRRGSGTNDHSGSGAYEALTGVHDSEESARRAGRRGVPNNNQCYLSRGKWRLEIQSSVDFPSDANAAPTACNICLISSR